MKKYHKKPKRIPKVINFYDFHGEKVKYFIEHDDEGLSSNDFFSFVCTTRSVKQRILLKNDGHVSRLLSLFQTTSAH